MHILLQIYLKSWRTSNPPWHQRGPSQCERGLAFWSTGVLQSAGQPYLPPGVSQCCQWCSATTGVGQQERISGSTGLCLNLFLLPPEPNHLAPVKYWWLAAGICWHDRIRKGHIEERSVVPRILQIAWPGYRWSSSKGGYTTPCQTFVPLPKRHVSHLPWWEAGSREEIIAM